MSDNLKRLKDAIAGRGRDVVVTPEGTVQETPREPDATAGAATAADDQPKPTKLAPRTFGIAAQM